MAGQKSVTQPHHTDDQKMFIGIAICELYESQNATIEECAKARGISAASFRLWCAQISELSERYKKAKENQNKLYWNEMVAPKAKTALLKLLEGGVKTDKKKETGMVGESMIDKDTVTESEFLSNPTAVIFALKGLFPDMFAERSQITGANGKDLFPPEITFFPKQIIVEVVKNGSSEGDNNDTPT